MVESHSNALLYSAASYEPPQPYHFIRRPGNLLTNQPDTLTAAWPTPRASQGACARCSLSIPAAALLRYADRVSQIACSE
ncbi:hypothetical protein EVAR_12118_1 [Eumeta japonica]|uniref:Uncharacterized protein n=1 Tax=Eumeta variegata TaxID=151549 RepID=A0A4C1U5W3_EUMVA|nr:hypothetical protein EVAR_12118_1 [Eumeta japonica]